MQGTAGEAKTNSYVTFFYVTPTYVHTSVGRPERIYLHRLCENTGCSREDLPGAIDDRDGWRERGKSVVSARLDDDDDDDGEFFIE